MSNQDVETAIRDALDRMGIQQDNGTAQDAPEQAHGIPVEQALAQAIGGPLALNNDQALGRIAGGAGATINSGTWGRLT